MSAAAAEVEPVVPVVEEKKPRQKRVMTPELLENLKKAREKALATYRDRKLLKEREELVEKETIEARWDKLHEEEEKLKKMQPKVKQQKTETPAAAVVVKKKRASRIVHMSPPLSSESSDDSQTSQSSESDEEFVPTNSRRAHRLKKRSEQSLPQPAPLPPPQKHQPQKEDLDANEVMLQKALKALGIRK
jgi:hypothetical protein